MFAIFDITTSVGFVRWHINRGDSNEMLWKRRNKVIESSCLLLSCTTDAEGGVDGGVDPDFEMIDH